MPSIESFVKSVLFPQAAIQIEPRLKELPLLESFYLFSVEEDLLEHGAGSPAISTRQKRLLSALLKQLSKKTSWETRALTVYLKICQGRYAEALLLARCLAREYPRKAITHLLKASALWMNEKLTQEHADRTWLIEARRAIERALALDAPKPTTLMLRAHVRRAMEDNENAVLDLKFLVKKNPKDWHARMILVEALFETKGFREALDHLAVVSGMHGDSWWVLAQQGHANGLLGNLSTALKFFNESIRLNPESGPLYAWKAEILRKMGLYRKSLEALNTAVKLAPSYIFTRVCRGRLWLMLGENKKALEDLTLASQICPADRLGRVWKAEALAKLGRWGEAWENYDSVMPLSAEIMWNSPSREGERVPADKRRRDFWLFWERSILESPRDPFPWLFRGRFQACGGKNLEAAFQNLSIASELARNKKTRAKALAWRGFLSLKGKSYGRALEDLDSACKQENKNLFQAWKASALAGLERRKQALAEWGTALRKPHPNLAPSFVKRGKLLWKMGRRPEALSDFEIAFCMDISYPQARQWLHKAERALMGVSDGTRAGPAGKESGSESRAHRTP